MSRLVTAHTDLDVYKSAFGASMEIFRFSRRFPVEERYSLTDQIRRSSRSVCASVAEAWRKRRYEAAFVSKLNDAEGEAAETQTWIEYCVKCDYIDRAIAAKLYKDYNSVLSMLVGMIV